MFKDEATFTVLGGRGGNGCVSFRREAFAPRGGPDGGDGGDGGDVVFEARDDEHSLLALTRRRQIKAEAGMPGLGSQMAGRNGEDTLVRVPTGTVLFDAETGELIADLREHLQRVIIARGGRGGFGNKHYATATNQTPRHYEPGRPGQERRVRAELRMIADVGLVGFPNAGKSTLLSICSHAKPKIAAYPFTTLEPQLGIVERQYARFVMADIPGLIEGASEGRGLGHQFLRHVERTRVILHLLDLTDGDLSAIIKRYHTIRAELERFSPILANKAEIVIGNKVDVPEAAELVPALEKALGRRVWPMSGATGSGLDEVLAEAWREVERARKEEPFAPIDEHMHVGPAREGAQDDDDEWDDGVLDGEEE